jgi:hypothetical protein
MTLLVGKKTNLSKFGHPFALLPIAPFQLMTPPKEKKMALSKSGHLVPLLLVAHF